MGAYVPIPLMCEKQPTNAESYREIAQARAANAEAAYQRADALKRLQEAAAARQQAQDAAEAHQAFRGPAQLLDRRTGLPAAQPQQQAQIPTQTLADVYGTTAPQSYEMSNQRVPFTGASEAIPSEQVQGAQQQGYQFTAPEDAAAYAHWTQRPATELSSPRPSGQLQDAYTMPGGMSAEDQQQFDGIQRMRASRNPAVVAQGEEMLKAFQANRTNALDYRHKQQDDALKLLGVSGQYAMAAALADPSEKQHAWDRYRAFSKQNGLDPNDEIPSLYNEASAQAHGRQGLSVIQQVDAHRDALKDERDARAKAAADAAKQSHDAADLNERTQYHQGMVAARNREVGVQAARVRSESAGNWNVAYQNGQPVLVNNRTGQLRSVDGMAKGEQSGGGTDTSAGMTTADKNRASLASIAMRNLDSMQAIVQRRPEILGKLGAVKTSADLLGSDDPDVVALGNEVHNFAMANAGIHGSRSVQNVRDGEAALLGHFKNGPRGVQGGIDANRTNLNAIISPRSAGAGVTYRKTATGQGGHKIGSNDDGRTWFDTQTGKQVQ